MNKKSKKISNLLDLDKKPLVINSNSDVSEISKHFIDMGKTLGLVALEKNFHIQDIPIIRRAWRECDVVFTSIFDIKSEFSKDGNISEKKSFFHDIKCLYGLTHIIFLPTRATIYPDGHSFFICPFDDKTTISINGDDCIIRATGKNEEDSKKKAEDDGRKKENIDKTMDKQRENFKNMCFFLTTIIKLSNLISPHNLYLSEKEKHHLFMVKKMCYDMNLSLKVIGCDNISGIR